MFLSGVNLAVLNLKLYSKRVKKIYSKRANLTNVLVVQLAVVVLGLAVLVNVNFSSFVLLNLLPDSINTSQT
jgi:hypothetical protein